MTWQLIFRHVNNFVSRLAKNVTTEHVTLEKKIKDVSKHTSNLNTFVEKGETYNFTSVLKRYNLFCCIFEYEHCIILSIELHFCFQILHAIWFIYSTKTYNKEPIFEILEFRQSLSYKILIVNRYITKFPLKIFIRVQSVILRISLQYFWLDC